MEVVWAVLGSPNVFKDVFSKCLRILCTGQGQKFLLTPDITFTLMTSHRDQAHRTNQCSSLSSFSFCGCCPCAVINRVTAFPLGLLCLQTHCQGLGWLDAEEHFSPPLGEHSRHAEGMQSLAVNHYSLTPRTQEWPYWFRPNVLLVSRLCLNSTADAKERVWD